jgi:uncharacterized protein YxjI
MKFPLDLTFKLLALSSQIYIRDASGQMVGYVKQKMFKLKEDISIFSDESQTLLLYSIKADRIIDFSANYHFTDASGRFFGSIKREGMRSFWKASYLVTDSNNAEVFRISEESGWTKVMDSLLSEIPVIGMFTGYVLNPAYLVKDTKGVVVARLAKQAAMLESKFNVELKSSLANNDEQATIMLAVLMTTLLEKNRG